MAEVLEVDDEVEEFLVKFMVRSGQGLYTWPENPETSWEPKASLVCSVQAPVLINNRGHFSFTEENFEAINCNLLKVSKVVKFQ